jgi:hypothetical protein
MELILLYIIHFISHKTYINNIIQKNLLFQIAHSHKLDQLIVYIT